MNRRNGFAALRWIVAPLPRIVTLLLITGSPFGPKVVLSRAVRLYLQPALRASVAGPGVRLALLIAATRRPSSHLTLAPSALPGTLSVTSEAQVIAQQPISPSTSVRTRFGGDDGSTVTCSLTMLRSYPEWPRKRASEKSKPLVVFGVDSPARMIPPFR